jgi:hypothetical protein
VRPRAIAPALLAGALLACSRGGPQRPPVQEGEQVVVPKRSIDEVLAAYNDSLMTLPGVVGTAVALCERGERCIKVLLEDARPETTSAIPTRIEGYRVITEVAGTIRPR